MPTYDDFSGIYPFIRNRMPDSLADVPDATLDPEIDSVVRLFLWRFKCIKETYGSYAGMGSGGDDKSWVDEAVGKVVAYRLLTPMTTGGANSDLVLEKTDTTTRQFGQISNTTLSDKDRWAREAAEAIGRVECVNAYFQSRAASFQPFVVSGPTRSAEAAGYPQTLLGAILSLIGGSADAALDPVNL